LENCHSDSLKKVQLTLSQSKKKKRDEVVDDKDDDDVVRTSVSQDQVTATHCVLRKCSSALSIYSSSRISDGQPGKGKDMDG
jgi:hypothetical protein